MSESLRESHVDLLMAEMTHTGLTCGGREDYWRAVSAALRAGVSRGFKERRSAALLELVFSRECEESAGVREASLEVLYLLMLCHSAFINARLGQIADELFHHLLYAFMSEWAFVRLTAENCLMRLLTNVMGPNNSFDLVVRYFHEADDLTNPDVCKLFTWTIERLSRKNISNDSLSLFVESLKCHMSTLSKYEDLTLKMRLKLICDKLSKKTGGSFAQIVSQIMRKDSKFIDDENSSKFDFINKYSKLSSISSRPRSANPIIRPSRVFFPHKVAYNTIVYTKFIWIRRHPKTIKCI